MYSAPTGSQFYVKSLSTQSTQFGTSSFNPSQVDSCVTASRGVSPSAGSRYSVAAGESFAKYGSQYSDCTTANPFSEADFEIKTARTVSKEDQASEYTCIQRSDYDLKNECEDQPLRLKEVKSSYCFAPGFVTVKTVPSQYHIKELHTFAPIFQPQYLSTYGPAQSDYAYNKM
uniref:Homeobox protein A11 n=1 Tax=Rhabditophanes sp. KR3021 TaxID=114890 RepID=A0AC35TS92_9BILA